MWIQNVAAMDVMNGFYRDSGTNVVLIQITNPGASLPVPPDTFASVHQFRFLDYEASVPFRHADKIQPNQALAIANVLKKAFEAGNNVVVHCQAGVSRSGAVVEAAIALGFEDLKGYRSPNLMVKHMIMDALGLSYDAQEPFTENGRPFIYDELNNKIFLEP